MATPRNPLIRLLDDRPDLTGRFLFIDGLRGLAALAVVLFHFYTPKVSPLHDTLANAIPAWLGFVLMQGDLGVEVFFALSGFVIAHSVRGAAVTPGFMLRFAARRSIRLDPPYWVVIGCIIGFAAISGSAAFAEAMNKWGGWGVILLNMVYLPDLTGVYRLVWVGWTLCLEVQFYLAFVVLTGLRQWLTPTLARCIPNGITLGYLLIFTPLALASIALWHALGRYDFFGLWFMFFMGALAYLALSRRVPWWWFILYAGGILIAGLVEGERRSVFAAATAIVIYLVGEAGGLRHLLSWRWLQHLGALSYSLYLVHLPIGVFLLENWPGGAAGHDTFGKAMFAYTSAIVASLLAAELLYRLIERPSLRLGRRVRLPRRRCG